MIRICQKDECEQTFDSPDTPLGNKRKYCDDHKATYKKSPLTNKYVQLLLTASPQERTEVYAKFLRLERRGEIETATMDIVEMMMFKDWQDGDKAAGKLIYGHKIPKQVEVKREIHEIGSKAAEALSGKTPEQKAKLLAEAAGVEVNSIIPVDFEVVEDD